MHEDRPETKESSDIRFNESPSHQEIIVWEMIVESLGVDSKSYYNDEESGMTKGSPA